MEYKFSLYESKEGKSASDLSLDNYIGYVQHGVNQDLVIKGRLLKKQGKEKEYKELKAKSKVITGSCVFETGKPKTASNIKALNGLIVIDIDTDVSEEQYHELKNDKYTFVIHKSFGGDGYCIFVKIDSNRFEDSFDGLADYYYSTYNIAIDQSCKNKNRLRFLSFDPDIHKNEKSNKFIPKNIKKFAPPKSTETNYVFHEDDFDNILKQISQRNIDLCQEDYHRYVRIGMSIAGQFGISGEDKFHFICQYGGKYNYKDASKDYKGFVKNSHGKVSIGTFYYYAKEAGIDIYTEKTKTIINRVKVAKTQGNPTVSSVVSNLKTANDIVANDADKSLIEYLINSKNDYSKEANKDLTEIEQVQQFIMQTYQPYYDEISNYIYVNDHIMEDKELNDIYLNVKKSFDFKVPINDIMAILNSNSIKRVNTLKTFLKENKGNGTGFIEEYARCIKPESDYNVWAFKKWIVGGIHNWICSPNDDLVCPLTLVLSGQQHGTGKTTFFRRMLPDELKVYFTPEKINGKDKDSMYRLCSSLIVFDDEFGGDGFKDIKSFKDISDKTIIVQRRPYQKNDSRYRRRALLCGSSNEVDILKDVTGNRRILPINVNSVDYDSILNIDKKSLIIEAYNLYKSGFDWIVRTKEDIDYIRQNTHQNEVILPVEEIFWKHFSIEKSNLYPEEKIMNQGDILEYLNRVSVIKPTKYEIKEVITKNRLNYTAHRDFTGNLKKGYKLYLSPYKSSYSESNEIEPPF